jgi:serine/threonine protein phosphatase 1
MLKLKANKASETRYDTACLPEGIRVYAVGDIHGRIDLLDTLQHRILDDSKESAPVESQKIVYLGDYVDRGMNSRGVIDRLITFPMPGFETVTLRGNHDQFLLDFLDEPESGGLWLKHGGDATLLSYGVKWQPDGSSYESLTALRDRFLECLPAPHISFLANCDMAYELGDYIFVHAGINPRKPLNRQDPSDLLWIRDAFLRSEVDIGKVVVHGHSVSSAPDVRHNRIGIDTGACYSNRLTALVLEGQSKRFLSTAI